MCEGGSEWIMWCVSSVDNIENEWVLMRSMSMEVFGLDGVRRLALKSPVMIML